MISQSKLKLAGRLLTLVAAFLIVSINAQAAAVLDTTFGSTGTVGVVIGNSAQSNGVVLYPDNKILVVGSVTRENTGQDTFLVRLLANGLPDQTFAGNGILYRAFSSEFESANAVALQPDGKIIVAGSYYSPQTQSIDFFVARMFPEGLLDPGFGSNGIFTLNQGQIDAFFAVAVQPDGKIVAAGRTSDLGSVAIVRLNPNGTPDETFDSGIVFLDLPNLINEYFGDIAFVENGRILVGGTATPFDGSPTPLYYTNILMLFDPDGTPNPFFGNQGLAQGGANHFAGRFDFEVLPDSRILTVGAATVRFLFHGGIDPAFQISAAPNDTLAVRRSDGKFITASSFVTNADARIFNPNGRFVGKAANFMANNSVVMPDDRVIFTRIENGNTLVLTRLLTISSQGTRTADLDNDDKTDIMVLRPSNSTFYVLNSLGNSSVYPTGEASFEIQRFIPERFGSPLPAAFAYWKGGAISGAPASFCRTDAAANRQCFQWGLNTDIPVGGDYDGDTFTDITVFRPSNGIWYIYQSSNNQLRAVQWGLPGDKPVPADYDYDGTTDIAVYRPSNGTWYVRRSSDGSLSAMRFGLSTDIPLTGDFDGDGRADFVVYRPSEGVWYLQQSRNGFRAERFGLETDSPVPGDYDGDGRHDVAVFRQGIWYILGSSRGFYAVQWGLSTDIPVAVRYPN